MYPGEVPGKLVCQADRDRQPGFFAALNLGKPPPGDPGQPSQCLLTEVDCSRRCRTLLPNSLPIRFSLETSSLALTTCLPHK